MEILLKKTVRSIYHIASFLITMVFQEAQLNLLAYYEYSTIMQICLECHSDKALILLKGRFYVFFNSISDISGRWAAAADTKRLCLVGWFGCFGFNSPLRQYFSLYRAVSQREGERGEKG